MICKNLARYSFITLLLTSTAILSSAPATLVNSTANKIHYRSYKADSGSVSCEGTLNPYDKTTLMLQDDLYVWQSKNEKSLIIINLDKDLPLKDHESCIVLHHSLEFFCTQMPAKKMPFKEVTVINKTEAALEIKNFVRADKFDIDKTPFFPGEIKPGQQSTFLLANQFQISQKELGQAFLITQKDVLNNTAIIVTQKLNFTVLQESKELESSKTHSRKIDGECESKEEKIRNKGALVNNTGYELICKMSDKRDFTGTLNPGNKALIPLETNIEIYPKDNLEEAIIIDTKSIENNSTILINENLNYKLSETGTTDIFNMNFRNLTNAKIFYHEHSFSDVPPILHELNPGESARVSIFSVYYVWPENFPKQKITIKTYEIRPTNIFIDVVLKLKEQVI